MTTTEPYWSVFFRSLLALAMFLLALPVIGLWAMASGIENLITKMKGG